MPKVMVVDDDRALLRLASLILRSEGLSVETSTGGWPALELLETTHPDLLFLDLNMPQMDGRSFFREARALGYEGPVVIFSAYDAAGARRELGAEAVLNKPFEPEVLSRLAKRLLP
jgi:CheY-like chemotaxis protein